MMSETTGSILELGKVVVDQSNFLDSAKLSHIKTEDFEDTSIVEIKNEDLSAEIRIHEAYNGDLDNLNTKDLAIKNENSNLLTKPDNRDYEESNKQSDLNDSQPKIDSMHKCDKCSYTAKRISYFAKHLAKHKNPPATYYCNECTYHTDHRIDLKKHIARQHKTIFTTIHKCTQCSYQTVHKDDIYTHIRRVHTENVPTYKCPDCSYKSKRPDNLTRHSFTHKKTEFTIMYNCSACSYQSTDKQNLARHTIIHSKPKDLKVQKRVGPKQEIIIYNCSKCSYQSKRKQHYIRHTLLHKKPEEIDMFKCKWCSFKTKFKSNLKAHSIRHLE